MVQQTHRHTGESHTRRPHRRAPADQENETPRRGRGRAGADQETEQPAGQQASSAAPETATDEDAMHRAEEMVDRIAARVGEFTASLGRQILRLGARAREEAEDIWAEADSIRRGTQS